MSRSFDKMCDLPTVVDDPKVQEFMEHYYAISNDGSDPEGFADIFTKDGEYSINDKISTGRDGMYTAGDALYQQPSLKLVNEYRDHRPP